MAIIFCHESDESLNELWFAGSYFKNFINGVCFFLFICLLNDKKSPAL